MKFRKLPPLHVLHTFEVAANHLSFKRAAGELALTPSAVSHQIAALEDFLGTRLFERRTRALLLTPAGEGYLRVVGAALEQLRDGTEQLRARYHVPRVTLSLAPLAGAERVIPYLAEFRARHPDIDLQIATEQKLRNLRKEDVDIALRLGDGNWPGVTTQLLMPLTVVPVCAPSRLVGMDALTALGELPLLGIEPLRDAWARYYSAAGLPLPTQETLWFDSFASLISACERGVGIGFGLLPLLAPWLHAGRLVPLLPEPQALPYAYYLAYRPEQAARPEVNAVINWVAERFDMANG